MNFQEAEQWYRTLRDQLFRKEITQQEFKNRVNDLRLKDTNGVWWQVREKDGGWFRWDGSTWIEDTPPGIPPVTQVQVGATVATDPLSRPHGGPQPTVPPQRDQGAMYQGPAQGEEPAERSKSLLPVIVLAIVIVAVISAVILFYNGGLPQIPIKGSPSNPGVVSTTNYSGMHPSPSVTRTSSVGTPEIKILPITDKRLGDKFEISGTTNLAVGDQLALSIWIANTSLDSYIDTGSTLVIKSYEGFNTWSFPVDTTSFEPDEYIVAVVGNGARDTAHFYVY